MGGSDLCNRTPKISHKIIINRVLFAKLGTSATLQKILISSETNLKNSSTFLFMGLMPPTSPRWNIHIIEIQLLNQIYLGYYKLKFRFSKKTKKFVEISQLPLMFAK